MSSADLWAALLFFAFHGTTGLRDCGTTGRRDDETPKTQAFSGVLSHSQSFSAVRGCAWHLGVRVV